MANLTRPTGVNVQEFLDGVADPHRREDARRVVALMQRVTGVGPVMWGPSMIGFGRHSYSYDSGRHGEWFTVGLAPRKAALTIYGIHDGYADADPLLGALGPHTLGKGCVYVKKVAALDLSVLEALIEQAWARRA